MTSHAATIQLIFEKSAMHNIARAQNCCAFACLLAALVARGIITVARAGA